MKYNQHQSREHHTECLLPRSVLLLVSNVWTTPNPDHSKDDNLSSGPQFTYPKFHKNPHKLFRYPDNKQADKQADKCI